MRLLIAAILVLSAMLSASGQDYRAGIEIQSHSPFYFVDHPYFDSQTRFTSLSPRNPAIAANFYAKPKWYVNSCFSYQQLGYLYSPNTSPYRKRLSYAKMSYWDISMNYDVVQKGRFRLSMGSGVVLRHSQYSYYVGNYIYEPRVVVEPKQRDIGLVSRLGMQFYPIKSQRIWISIRSEYDKFKDIDTWSNSVGLGLSFAKSSGPFHSRE